MMMMRASSNASSATQGSFMMMMMMMMRASSDASYATQGSFMHMHVYVSFISMIASVFLWFLICFFCFGFEWPCVSASCKIYACVCVCVCVYQFMYFAFLVFKLSSCRHVWWCLCISINKLHLNLCQNYCSSYPLW
jgi:hypothetical protein